MALRENGGQPLKTTSKHPKILLIHSDELVKLCDKLPKVPNRVSRFLFFTFYSSFLCLFSVDSVEKHLDIRVNDRLSINLFLQASLTHSLIKAYGLLENIR